MIEQKQVTMDKNFKQQGSLDLMSHRKQAKRGNGGFSSLSQKIKLNVDLSEDQMKISESVSVPFSCLTGATRHLLAREGNSEEIHKGSYVFGASSRKGDFRRTQEDRVSRDSLSMYSWIPISNEQPF